MGSYILKRLLLIIPTSLLALLIVFALYEISFISNYADLNSNALQPNPSAQDQQDYDCQLRKALHLDWPLFYFSVKSSAIHAKLNSICADHERRLLRQLCLISGNPELSYQLFDRLKTVGQEGQNFDMDKVYSFNSIEALTSGIENIAHKDPTTQTLYNEYLMGFTRWKTFIPGITINSSQNRFHEWLVKSLTLEFGVSVVDGQQVAAKVHRAMFRTLVFTIPAVILIFISAIGIAALMLHQKSSAFLSNVLYLIDAIPMFWLAILLLLLFSNVGFLSWSYTESITTSSASDAQLQYLWDQIAKHSLPILTLVIASIPYVTKQIHSALQSTLEQPYVLTARGKGLSEKQIFRNHILKNALIPVLSIFFNFLAFAFGGAFVVEMVYSINGIGKLMADSVLANDFPVISTIILYLILVRMLATLLNDIANYLVDPAIKF